MKWPFSWRSPATWSLFRADDRLLLIVIAVMVGLCAGLAALALNSALHLCLHALAGLRGYWWAFALPAAGAALAAVFLDKIVKEGAGHGVPEVIYSVSRYGGLLRLRSSFSRLISSCLTIGSGGSAGPEAPVVMSGAAIGSNIARAFSLNDRQRVTLVGCGAAGAIAAIFNAPIAGMVFAVEVILGEWTALNIIPIAIASVSGCEISRILQGNQIPFTHQQFIIDLSDILAAAGLALVCALVSVALTALMTRMHHTADRVPAPKWARAAIGGASVGLMGAYMPLVLGEGYQAVQEMISGGFTPGLAIVAVAVLAKMLATSLTLGWGGSGGIFAPCLVVGSLVGLTYHRALVGLWPDVAWVGEGCFALLGMAGMISGILQAPLTGIFLIVEITGSYDVILPLIVVSALSTTVCHMIEPASFYLRELVERGHLLRPGTDARVLSDLTVRELIETDCTTVARTMSLGQFIDAIQRSRRNHFAVVHETTEHYLGMVHLQDIRPYLFNPSLYDTVYVDQIMDNHVPTASVDDDVAELLSRMDALNLFAMPVVVNRRFLGLVSKATLLDQYRRELKVQTGH